MVCSALTSSSSASLLNSTGVGAQRSNTIVRRLLGVVVNEISLMSLTRSTSPTKSKRSGLVIVNFPTAAEMDIQNLF